MACGQRGPDSEDKDFVRLSLNNHASVCDGATLKGAKYMEGFPIPAINNDMTIGKIVELFPSWALDMVCLVCDDTLRYCIKDDHLVILLSEGDIIFPDGTIKNEE